MMQGDAGRYERWAFIVDACPFYSNNGEEVLALLNSKFACLPSQVLRSITMPPCGVERLRIVWNEDRALDSCTGFERH